MQVLITPDPANFHNPIILTAHMNQLHLLTVLWMLLSQSGSTICIGLAASMGAFLLAGGTKGKRYALPNAEVMIHQPSGGAKGQATEIQIAAENILKTKKKLNEILAANTGKPYDVVAADTERDYYMSAEEAKAYGLIDDVIIRKDTKKEESK